MTSYHIDPRGINAVFSSVEGVLNGELKSSATAAYNALDDAVLAYPDGRSPIYRALRIAQARSAMAVRGVAAETGTIVSIASQAANEYVKADDAMARQAHARAAAAHDIDAYQNLPAAEAKARQLQNLR